MAIKTTRSGSLRSAFFKYAILFVMMALLQPGQAYALCVKGDRVNLRSAPSPSAPITWQVGRHMPLIKVASKDGWYKAKDLDGVLHWVAASQVREGVDCVVVRVKNTILRQGPGKQNTMAEWGVADRYTPFRKLDQQGDWVQVEDEDPQKAWVKDAAVWAPINKMVIKF